MAVDLSRGAGRLIDQRGQGGDSADEDGCQEESHTAAEEDSTDGSLGYDPKKLGSDDLCN